MYNIVIFVTILVYSKGDQIGTLIIRKLLNNNEVLGVNDCNK